MSITDRYSPYYRATPDYAYEVALRVEACAESAAAQAAKAQQTANYARGLHKDLDERTRNIEKTVKTLQANVDYLRGGHNIGISRINGLEERVKALEPKPTEPTKAELIATYTKQLEDMHVPLYSSDYLTVSWFLEILKKINRAP